MPLFLCARKLTDTQLVYRSLQNTKINEHMDKAK